MIKQYKFSLLQKSGEPLPSFWAYRLYAWMLEQVPYQYGEKLHMDGETPISQYLYLNRDIQKSVWVVNLLTEEMVNVFSPIFDNAKTIELHENSLSAVLQTVCEEDASRLLQREKNDLQNRRTRLCFATPTAFKSERRYGIFPQEKWILQNLANKWNLMFSDILLNDTDAFVLLEQGLHIVDYSLRTVRYPLKHTKIPAFVGNVVIESKLPAPLQEIWQLLLSIAPYSGIGIKTTLGMGGVLPLTFKN